MNDRINPFADIGAALPNFTPKQRKSVEADTNAVEKLAEESGFQKRQPPRREKAQRRTPRTYRTGRNIQFNSKVTQETQDKIYRLADTFDVKIGELLEMAINALEREGKGPQA